MALRVKIKLRVKIRNIAVFSVIESKFMYIFYNFVHVVTKMCIVSIIFYV